MRFGSGLRVGGFGTEGLGKDLGRGKLRDWGM